MKIVYFGTPAFAAEVLSFLLKEGVEVVAVITKPDKPKGRSGKLVPTPVKLVAQEHSLPVYQPEKVSDPQFAPTLASYPADLYVVVAYGEIIKQHILDIPPRGCINLHASLLPKYRGAAPIQSAIIHGEAESGVTVIEMVKKMDAGKMLIKASVPIAPDETFGELESKLCAVGCTTLLQAIRMIEAGTAVAEAQNEELVTFAPKIELEDCQIDWSRPASQIHNLVRGVNPYPGAWCYVKVKGEKKRLKVIKTRVSSGKGQQPGTLLREEKNTLCIQCGRDALLIKELQLEGKKPMNAEALLCGVSLDQLDFM